TVNYSQLHSFPTRRSSDLGVKHVGPVAAGGDVDVLAHFLNPAEAVEVVVEVGRVDDQRALVLQNREGEDVAAEEFALHQRVEGVDRKSTRLNSSHVSISYA